MSRRRRLREKSLPETLVGEAQDEGSGKPVSQDEGSEKPFQEELQVEEKPSTANYMEWLGIPWHLVMVVFYSLLIYHGFNLMRENAHILDPEGKIPSFGGRFKYLTHINQWVQLIFFSAQLLTDLVPKSKFKSTLQKFSDLIFTTIAFPMAAVVVVTFWGIYAVDRSLVFPEVFDLFVPLYLNHLWHTTVILWVLCEIYFVHHCFPTTGTAAASVFVYGSAYIAWLVYIFASTGWWAYPFLKVLPIYGMALFFGSSLFLTLGLHLMGKWISYVCWGKITYMD